MIFTLWLKINILLYFVWLISVLFNYLVDYPWWFYSKCEFKCPECGDGIWEYRIFGWLCKCKLVLITYLLSCFISFNSFMKCIIYILSYIQMLNMLLPAISSIVKFSQHFLKSTSKNPFLRFVLFSFSHSVYVSHGNL